MPNRPRIALVTAEAARPHDTDLPPLVEAARTLGAEVDVPAWHDETVAWGTYDLVLVRSTWDYVARRDEFLAWAERVGSVAPLWNPAPVLAWNTDKHYLVDLAAAGVPVVPTAFVEPGQDSGPALAQVVAMMEVAGEEAAGGNGAVVVKPAVGVGAQDAARHAADAAGLEGAAAHVARLGARGASALVQPYLDRVDVEHETGLVFFGGSFSHAFAKAALLDDGDTEGDGTLNPRRTVAGLYVEERIVPRTPTAEQLDVAAAALAAVPATFTGGRPLAYARVDLLPSAAGPLVIELELVEPSFFLQTDPTAAARFASLLESLL